jgi:ATPase family associated with various cellular activities (AAA)
MSNQDNNSKQVYVGPDYGRLMQGQTNSTIIEAFIKILFDKNQTLSFSCISRTLVKLALLLVMKSALEDSKSLLDKFSITNLSIVRWFYQRLRYTTITSIIDKNDKVWCYEKKPLSNNLSILLARKGVNIEVPGTYYSSSMAFIYKIEITSTYIKISYPNIETCRCFFSEIIRSCSENILGGLTKLYSCSSKNMKGGVLTLCNRNPAVVFPCDNYEKLEKSLTNYVVNSDKLMNYKPYAINFDGPPGTGKTSFSDYISTKGILHKIVSINMMIRTEKSFVDVLNEMNNLISNLYPKDKEVPPENILIIFDELDKWLSSYVDKVISELREKSGKQETTSDGKNNKERTIVEKILTPEDEENKRRDIHFELLDVLYNLFEGNMLKNHRYFIILNTNESDKLFGDLPKKYDALKSRIHRYNFSECNKERVILFFENMKQTVEHKRDLTPLYEKIPENIIISYRRIYQLFVEHSCSIEETLDELSK